MLLRLNQKKKIDFNTKQPILIAGLPNSVTQKGVTFESKEKSRL
jgi:hypothetical protein